MRLARSLCADVEFSCEDATRTETDFLYQVCRAAVEAVSYTHLDVYKRQDQNRSFGHKVAFRQGIVKGLQAHAGKV